MTKQQQQPQPHDTKAQTQARQQYRPQSRQQAQQLRLPQAQPRLSPQAWQQAQPEFKPRALPTQQRPQRQGRAQAQGPQSHAGFPSSRTGLAATERSRAAHIPPLGRQQEALFLARRKRYDTVLFGCFITVLWIFAVLFWLSGSSSVDQNEKRSLTQLPKFSWQALRDGSLTKDFESYYADQFPGRRQLIKVNQGVKQLLQGSLWQGAGELKIINARKDAGGQGDAVISPSTSLISNAQPTVTPQAQASTAPTELMAPAPSLGNVVEPEYQSTSIIISQGRAMEVFYYSKAAAEAYAQRLNALAAKLPSPMRLINLLVPTAISFYGPDELRTGGNSEYDAIRQIYESEDKKITKIDAFSALAKHSSEYIYFRTDHHWNGRGAYYAYEAFCQTLGLTARPLAELELTQSDNTFMGSLYGYTENSPLLLQSEDKAEIFLPPEQGKLVWYSDASMSDPQEGVLLNAKFPQSNQYMLYSGGDVALALISSSLKNGKKICVLKDSYGNGFVPYLMSQYEEVYVIDPRRFSDPLLPFLQKQGIQDVLVLNYSFAMANPTWLAGFEQICGLAGE